MEGMYNPLKLPKYIELFSRKKIAIIGAGAVGSYLAEYIAKMGVGRITLIDFDTFTLENAAKHSCIVRTPEDVGRNKAVTVAERAQELMIPGGFANGIDTDICMLGPMAFSEYDAVLLALDNYAAKVYFNQLWLQIPESIRPLLISGGTNEEMAQSNCLDSHDACLRCLFDESWLVNPAIRTSCSGPQYRSFEGERVIVRTSGLASSLSAHLMVEQLRAWILKIPNITNKRLCYTAFPNIGLTSSSPLKRNSCPDCKTFYPPKKITSLEGSITDTTLEEFFSRLSTYIGSNDYELNVNILNYANVGYGGLIINDYCHCCGKPILMVNSHEGRTYSHDMLCIECKDSGKIAHYDPTLPSGDVIYAFKPGMCSPDLLSKTLFQLGWQLGSYLWVVQKGNTHDALDEGIKYHCFSLSYDSDLIFKVSGIIK